MAPPGHTVVIGGGFAGLSCAVALTGRGGRVTLLEARRELGGRATSFVDAPSGDVVDNGQHLFMACYRATRSFLETIGTAHLVRYQRRLRVDYLLEGGRRSVLRGAPLPAPWHLAAGILAMKGLAARDRAALVSAGPALRALSRPDAARELESATVTDWLDRIGQPAGLRRLLWHPLAVATLNASPHVAPASLLACVLREGFLASASSSRLGVSTVGLSELYAEPARRWLEGHGARVMTGVPVAHLRVVDGTVRAAVLRDGTELAAEAFVCALPPEAARRLEVPVMGLERFSSSPIVSINLWPGRPLRALDSVDFAAIPDGTIQWIFNRGRILGSSAGHLAGVVSAAESLKDHTGEELARAAWRELGERIPEARSVPLHRWQVVRERTATFSASVDTEPLRPGPRTSWANLLLAGDWTLRGMPATIESAVRSGQTCAEMLVQAEGVPLMPKAHRRGDGPATRGGRPR